MKFDFSVVQGSAQKPGPRSPKDIFKLLTKKDRKYAYLRDVQAEVLDAWYTRKDKSEVVIKMNTGSGKTVVSLLILQSCLEHEFGPAVYVVPDNYLLSQVEREAAQLGIPTTTDPTDLSYLRLKSILLINIHKLFNARSVFGVGDAGAKIPIGTLLIDDAHACIDKLEEQFTIDIESGDPRYKQLFELFRHDLVHQSESKTSDLEVATPGASLQVPFWSIQTNAQKILNIFGTNLDKEDPLFWRVGLVKEFIKFSDCVVSSHKIEFSLRIIPTSIIASYDHARKIVVSATLPDDTVLRSTLNISRAAIEDTITPSEASDLGERLIIVPQDINPHISKKDVKALLAEYAQRVKVVVIVPSRYRADEWKDIAQEVLLADNIQEGLARQATISHGLIVLVNKYDGVDLPDDACRILVIDELPSDRSEIEKVDTNVLSSYNYSVLRKVRKIEQGMGRAIRSSEDYSVVVLLGRSLTNHLFSVGGMKGFTPATRQQLMASASVLEQVKRGNIGDIREAIEVVLTRNEGWVSAIKSSLIGLKFSPQIPNEISFFLREAYEAAWVKQYDKAVEILEACANRYTEKSIQGWLKYYVAMFANFIDPANAQTILKSGLSLNSKIVKPLEGIRYQKHAAVSDQAEKAKEYLAKFESKPNTLLVRLNSVFEDLIFRPETFEQFESAIMELGQVLGFGSERPENEFGKGPDNLWICGGLNFFVIECKNGCTSETINKHDTNQINGSILWFESEYDTSCNGVPILIHPRTRFEHAATPNPKIRIIDGPKLEEFKTAVYQYAMSSIQSGQIAELDKIRKLLQDNRLTPKGIMENFTKPV